LCRDRRQHGNDKGSRTNYHPGINRAVAIGKL